MKLHKPCCSCTLSPHGGTNTKFRDRVSTRDYCASRYRDVIHFASGQPGIRGDCTVHMCCNQMLPPPVPISVWIKTEGILHLTISFHVHGTGVPVESCEEAFAPDKHKVEGFTSSKHRLSQSSIFTRFTESAINNSRLYRLVCWMLSGCRRQVEEGLDAVGSSDCFPPFWRFH